MLTAGEHRLGALIPAKGAAAIDDGATAQRSGPDSPALTAGM
jgi:hypothetical protein